MGCVARLHPLFFMEKTNGGPEAFRIRHWFFNSISAARYSSRFSSHRHNSSRVFTPHLL